MNEMSDTNIINVNHISCKSNYTNTIKKLYNVDEEAVKQLQFYDHAKKEATLFNFKPVETNLNRNNSPKITFKHSKVGETARVAKNKLEKEMMEFKATKESQREKRRIYLEEKIREHKRERRILIQKINRNEKEIENTKVLIEFIHKFDILFPDDVYGHPKNYFDEEISKFRLQSEKSKAIIKKENEIKEHESTIEEINKVKETHKVELDIINTQIQNLKNELTAIKNELLVDYHQKLNIGKETKEEGLVWIIKAIWNLGFNVSVSFFPNFLDQASIDYLFAYAKMELEHAKLRNDINNLKNETHNYKPTLMPLKNDDNYNNTFKTEINKKRGLRKWISKKTIKGLTDSPIKKLKSNFTKDYEAVLTDPNLSYKILSEIFKQSRDNIDIHFENFKKETMEHLKAFETKERNIINELKTLKRNEIERLREEFYHRDYERRFNVTFLDMLSVIVGQSQCHIEFTNIERDLKVFQEKLKNVRTYDRLGESIKLPKI